MKVNRRDFLKVSGGALAVTAIGGDILLGEPAQHGLATEVTIHPKGPDGKWQEIQTVEVKIEPRMEVPPDWWVLEIPAMRNTPGAVFENAPMPSPLNLDRLRLHIPVDPRTPRGAWYDSKSGGVIIEQWFTDELQKMMRSGMLNARIEQATREMLSETL